MLKPKEFWLIFSFLLPYLALAGLIYPAFADDKIPFNLPEQAKLNHIRSAQLSTEKGEIYFELYPEDAPWHVANFKYLADIGYYKGLTFHIVHPNYIVQAGAPPNNPNGGPGYSLPAEFNQHKHIQGALGMARKADDLNPNRQSNGSQFHILMTESARMDGAFTVFGKVIKGMDIVNSLEKGDKILDLKVFVRK